LRCWIETNYIHPPTIFKCKMELLTYNNHVSTVQVVIFPGGYWKGTIGIPQTKSRCSVTWQQRRQEEKG